MESQLNYKLWNTWKKFEERHVKTAETKYALKMSISQEAKALEAGEAWISQLVVRVLVPTEEKRKLKLKKF